MTTTGSILWSGGIDSTALGLLMRRQGERLQAVYCCHRRNGGNVTKKEIVAASKLADAIWQTDMLIVYWKRKGGPPTWLDEYGDVGDSRHMPVPTSAKDHRNRRMLQALDDHDLADGTIGVGIIGIPSERGGRQRAIDTDPAELRKLHPGIVSGNDYATDKADLIRKVGRRGNNADLLYATESCLMYFAKHCGNCWSCVDRARAFMAAWGEDRTDYRKDTTAWKVARGRE